MNVEQAKKVVEEHRQHHERISTCPDLTEAQVVIVMELAEQIRSQVAQMSMDELRARCVGSDSLASEGAWKTEKDGRLRWDWEGTWSEDASAEEVDIRVVADAGPKSPEAIKAMAERIHDAMMFSMLSIIVRLMIEAGDENPPGPDEWLEEWDAARAERLQASKAEGR